ARRGRGHNSVSMAAPIGSVRGPERISVDAEEALGGEHALEAERTLVGVGARRCWRQPEGVARRGDYARAGEAPRGGSTDAGSPAARRPRASGYRPQVDRPAAPALVARRLRQGTA